VTTEEAKQEIAGLIDSSDQWVFIAVRGDKAAWVYSHTPLKARCLIEDALRSANERNWVGIEERRKSERCP